MRIKTIKEIHDQNNSADSGRLSFSENSTGNMEV